MPEDCPVCGDALAKTVIARATDRILAADDVIAFGGDHGHVEVEGQRAHIYLHASGASP